MLKGIESKNVLVTGAAQGGAGFPLATGAMFFGAGFGIASTFSRMPGIRDQLGVSPDQLAFALVFLGIGSLLGLPFAGRFVERYSSRTVSLVATAVFLSGCAQSIAQAVAFY